MMLSQEVVFAQQLANNSAVIRSKALKKLRKYYTIKSTTKSGILLDDQLKIWKGLFYSMYMSDKPLIQEKLAEDISNLIHHIKNKDGRRYFTEASFRTFAREWQGIDVFRCDKMMMFVRRVIRQIFTALKKQSWELEEVSIICGIFEAEIICPSDNVNCKPLGLKLHLCDIILEELAKVGKEDLEHVVILTFLQPYMKVLALSNINPYVKRVKERVIRYLMRQSDLGIMEQEGLLENEEMVEKDQTENMEQENGDNDDGGGLDPRDDDDEPLDPRAGGVDVCLPQLRPDMNSIGDALQSMGSINGVSQRKRNLLYGLAKEFRDLAEGVYPLSISQEVPENAGETERDFQKEVHMAVSRMKKYEKNLSTKYDIGKKKKLKKGLSFDVKAEVSDDESSNNIIMSTRRFKDKSKKRGEVRNVDNPFKEAKKLKKDVDEKIKKISVVAGIPTKTHLDRQAGNIVKKLHKKKTINELGKRKSLLKFNISELDSSSIESPNKRTGDELNQTTNSHSPERKKLKIHGFKVSTISNSPSTVDNKNNSPLKKKIKNSKLISSMSGKNNKFTEVKKNKVKNDRKICSNVIEPVNVSQKTTEMTTDSTNSLVLNFSGVPKEQLGFGNKVTSNGIDSSPNGWGLPPKEGETEVFIKSRQQIDKEKRLKLQKKKDNKITKKKLKKCSKNKTIKIDLNENKTHLFSDYSRSVQLSPCIPFKADKLPKPSVLKPSPSPILIHRPVLKTLRSIPTVASSSSPYLKSNNKRKRLMAADFFQ